MPKTIGEGVGAKKRLVLFSQAKNLTELRICLFIIFKEFKKGIKASQFKKKRCAVVSTGMPKAKSQLENS